MALFSFDRYSEDMLGKLLIGVGIISGVILVIIINMTKPASAGAFGILTVFLLGYLLVVSATSFIVYGVSHMTTGVSNMFVSRPVEGLTLRRSYYYSTIIALAPVIVVSMQSVGGVGPYELALIALLVVLGCVYVTKRTT